MIQPIALILSLVLVVSVGCRTLPETPGQTAMHPIGDPWSIDYSDGAGNAFRFAHPVSDEPITVSYDPVTPVESSSGTYSGGTAKEGTLDAAAATRLWELLDSMASAKDQQTENREKLTGAFTVTTPNRSFVFIMRPGPMLDGFEAFVEPYRGPDKPVTAQQSEENPLVTMVGVATIAKVGALLQTDDGTVWVDLREWPDEAFGKSVEVQGRWTSRADLPVFIAKEGEPVKAGMPVPPGTDLIEASTRDVLIVESWKVIP